MSNDALQENRKLHPVADVIRPYSQSPWPMWTVAGIFLSSAVIPPKPGHPHLLYRLGFGAIFCGAGYVISTGDVYNGTGISTAWSLAYLVLNLKKSLTRPLNGLSLALSGAALATSALYGTEYFALQEQEDV